MSTRTPDLRQTQQLLRQLITSPDGVAAALARSGGDTLPVRPSRTLTAIERVEIYAQMYFARIRDALREDFPACCAVVGAEAFTALVRRYLSAHPPHRFSLRYAGEQLAAFLATDPLRHEYPYLADLARFEWALIGAFDAPEAPILTAATLQQYEASQWSALSLRTIPALHVLDVQWPIDTLWETRATATGPQPLPQAPVTLAVWRRGFEPVYRRIDTVEASCLRRIGTGCTFGALCDHVLRTASDTDPTTTAARLLAQWLANECLTDLAPAT